MNKPTYAELEAQLSDLEKLKLDISNALKSIAEYDAENADLKAQLADAKKDAEWYQWIPVSERLPALKKDSSKELIITCKRKHNGKSYVFTAQYLESLVLKSTDSDDDEPEDGLPYTGWKQLEQVDNSEFDEAWFDIETDGDLVTHWMEKPLPIDAAIAEGRQA